MTTEIVEDIKIDEKIKKKTTEPKKFNVIMFNDDITPIDWVIGILKQIYKHTDSSAEQLTLTIHTEGKAVVGTYFYEIAEQKATETINASRNHGFPLQVKIEQE
jgi:ATP-dependent Clp protease adaptor protein ClpS